MPYKHPDDQRRAQRLGGRRRRSLERVKFGPSPKGKPLRQCGECREWFYNLGQHQTQVHLGPYG